MSDFDVDSYIKDHAPGSGGGFDLDGYISDHAGAKPSPGFFDGSVKSTINALPMLGGVVGGILGTPADALTGPVGNMAGAAIGGYVGTAAKNLINKYYDPESAPKNMTQVMAQPVVGGVEQGLMQGTGEAVAPYVAKGVRAVGQGAKWAGTKLLSSFGGVNPDVIGQYAQYSDRINSAPSVDALKEVSDDFVGKLASDVEAKKLSVEQASGAFKGLQSDLKDAYRAAGYDARDAVTSAEQSLKDAHSSRLQQMAGDIYDTVGQLKSDVSTGSSKALDVLAKSDAHVDLEPVFKQIDSTVNSLKKSGTDEALSVAEKLEAYQDRLTGTHGTRIPAPDAKKLIQGLDQITEYSPMAGSFDKAKNAAFKDVRAALDETLKKTVPEYRAAMEPVAKDADLLGRVGNFGDKQTAVGLLQRVNAPNQLENRAALEELGKKYGSDFVAGAQPENLPEQAILTKAQAAQEALRPDRVAGKLDQTLANSRQQSALTSAQSNLEAAQQKLAPFKSLAPNSAGQTAVQQKLEQLASGKNIELKEMFTQLGKMTNTDFVQAMKDQGIQAAFKKGAMNGSRNTLMGAAVGWAFGGVTGGAYGAAAGRAVDQWGPAITKKILDASIRVSNAPTMATIRALDLPEPIKRNMIVGLENYLTRDSAGAGSALRNVAQNQTQAERSPAAPSGEDKWARQGVQTLGIQDQAMANRLMQDPKARQLLIQASDYKPGSKALKRIQDQIQKGWGK